ncbi:MAG: ABC transporter ATP-binding protein [Actinobacteria bacterium]|nr:MAG: ABC transporter ATP-binding protein [Actinomycetota bacterium]
MTSAALLELRSVTKSFRGGGLIAVDDVSLEVGSSETVGVVGPSGAGKSTVARLVAGLLTPDAGAIVFEGTDLATLGDAERRAVRRRLHLVFQDPYTSLAGHLRVADLVAEPLVIHGACDRATRTDLVAEALAAVQLAPARYLTRWPHELSGGERQRVALARALVLRPRLVIADEPTAMLDPRARAELLELMAELQARLATAYLFITHDLAVADHFCDRLVVMSRGAVVEEGPTESVVTRPRHPATAALVDAARRLQAAVPA